MPVDVSPHGTDSSDDRAEEAFRARADAVLEYVNSPVDSRGDIQLNGNWYAPTAGDSPVGEDMDVPVGEDMDVPDERTGQMVVNHVTATNPAHMTATAPAHNPHRFELAGNLFGAREPGGGKEDIVAAAKPVATKEVDPVEKESDEGGDAEQKVEKKAHEEEASESSCKAAASADVELEGKVAEEAEVE